MLGCSARPRATLRQHQDRVGAGKELHMKERVRIAAAYRYLHKDAKQTPLPFR